MNELARAFSRFARRDIPYVLGGMSVFLSAFLGMDRAIPQKPSAVLLIIAASLSYVIGIIIQEMLAILLPSLVTSTTAFRPGRLTCWLYQRSAHYAWQDPGRSVDIRPYARVFCSYSDKQLALLERMFGFQCLGTALGCSGLMCFVILLVGLVFQESYVLKALLCACAGISGLVLLMFAQIQTMQIMRVLDEMEQQLQSRNTETP